VPLGQLQAEFHRTDLGDKGTFYRVLAGPLPSRDEATQVCAALKAKDARQYCRILPSKPKA
jgi:cell division septation protein DedD